MSHHPTFRKIYCDAVPYLFKKVRYSLWALFLLAIILRWHLSGTDPCLFHKRLFHSPKHAENLRVD